MQQSFMNRVREVLLFFMNPWGKRSGGLTND